MFTICTSFGEKGYEQYGRRFLDGANQFLPQSVELIAYVEAPCVHPRAHFRMFTGCHGARDFLRRHADNKSAHGISEAGGYSMRTDAYKFFRKPLVIRDAARRMGHGTLIWLDADVVFLRPLPADFATQVMRGSDVAYLGRRNHSECGFVAMRLPQALPLIDRWADAYVSDDVFKLPEWHDSYVFDFVRIAQQEHLHNAIEFRSISNTAERGHVWCGTILAKYLDHLKGDKRKALGRSPEHPSQ